MSCAEAKEPKRILVVDDEELNRELLSAILIPQGYDVVDAECGHRAIELLESESIDLILLDILMPGMDGVETCRQIRGNPKYMTLPIIVVTALHDRESRLRAKAMNPDDFLTKPVDEVELLVRIRNLLTIKAYHDLRAQHQEHLEKELEKIRTQLLHAEHLATLGTVAAGVGHELNNLSMVLSGLVVLFKNQLDSKTPSTIAEINQLKTVATHLAEHATQMLSLGRPKVGGAGPVDLRTVASNTLTMLKNAGRTSSIKVSLAFPPANIRVRVNQTHIEQVLINLISNATDAFDDDSKGGRVTIGAQLRRDTPGRVHVCVDDNGRGISKDKLPLIFEPYYTTKSSGRGTGLGLGVVRQIIRSYGGEVIVETEEGSGSVFWFDLPCDG